MKRAATWRSRDVARTSCPRLRGSEDIHYCTRQHSNTRVYIIYSKLLSSTLREVSHLEPARTRGFVDEKSREDVFRDGPTLARSQLSLRNQLTIDAFFIIFYNGNQDRVRIMIIITIIVFIVKIISFYFRDIVLLCSTILQIEEQKKIKKFYVIRIKKS